MGDTTAAEDERKQSSREPSPNQDPSSGGSFISPVSSFPPAEPTHPPCPEIKANFLSRLFYEWLTPFMIQSYKKPLESQDLFELAQNNSAQTLADEFQRLWEEEKTTATLAGHDVSIARVLYRQFGVRYLLVGLLHLVQAAANIGAPALIGAMTLFVQNTQAGTPQPLSQGFLYALLFFALQIISTTALNKYFHHSMRCGMRIRSCLTAVAYRKLMKLNGLSRQKFTSGQVVNMISSDMSRIEMFIMQGAYLWSGPLQIFSILALLISLIGASALAGFALLLIMIPVQASIFIRLAALRRDVAGTTDARIRLTQEFLQGMRIIKLFAWEEKFLDRLMALRQVEITKIKYVNLWTAVMMGIATSIPVFASVVAFVVYAAVGNTLSAPVIFTALAYFNLMRFPLILLPSVIRLYAETNVALKRLGAFMNAGELEAVANTQDPHSEYAIEVVDGNFQWEVLPDEQKFQDKPSAAASSKEKKPAQKEEGKGEKGGADLEMKEFSNIATTAATKATTETTEEVKPRIHLRNIQLKIKKKALVAVVGSVGSGKSTLISSLLGETKKVSGDVKVNGTVGYALQQPWIQNGTLRNNVTFGNPYDDAKYKEAVRVSALEKDLEWLPGGSDTLLGEKGIQASGGQRARVSLARIVYCNPDVVLLDDPLSAVDVHVGKHIFHECIREALKEKTVILVTHQLNYLREVDYILFMKDGEIAEQGTYTELMAANQECARLVNSFAGGQDEQKDSAASTATNKKDKSERRGKGENKEKAKKMLEEERIIGRVDPEVYKSYLASAGGKGMLVGVILITLLAQGTRVGNDLWLAAWTANSFSDLSTGAYSGVYLAWGVTQGLAAAALGAVLSFAFAAASNTFHKNAIHGVFRAPILFFDKTPLGRILNRFSKDTDTMDAQLPMVMQMFLTIFAGLLATLVLMCVAVWQLILPLIPLSVLYYYMQQVYLRTSRELKRLESLSRSPVFTHFSESMTGLSTVRAYCRQDMFIAQCFKHIDGNNQAAYLQIVVQRWLGFRLEVVGAVICFCTAAFVISFPITASLAGLALSYSLQVTGSLNFAVRQAVEVEVNANSIERLHHYAEKLDREAEYVVEGSRPPKEWPHEGSINAKDLVIQYTADGAPVLKHVSFDIQAKEKVGIVGRTGAGKSTITLALFRLLEPTNGSITIDGVQSSTIGLHDLRSRLAIIPQDPILFSGTVHTNLDPFNQYTDQEMWDVLASVNMKDAIAKLPDGLHAKVDANGENFSTGQRQLLCLARAMLRRPRVLIMDEATANVDMESDALIQTSLRKDFTQSTILTIAHRLNTVIDYDRIMVLEQGELVEFDTPSALLEKREGMFAKMVENTGPTNAALLRKLAAEKEKQGQVDISKLIAVDVKAE